MANNYNTGDASPSLTLGSALPAGANNIGDVDVVTLPALAAGTANIGDVDVLTLPALPAGANAIGKLAANDGVDIGDVTINNAAGGAAVPIQDGGNSITVDGSVSISGTVDTELPAAAALADAAANPTAPAIDGRQMLFNGTTWDRQRGNHEVVVLASAARTATTNSTDQVNYNSKGLALSIDVTAITGTPALSNARLQLKVGGSYLTVYDFVLSSVSAVGVYAVLLYPGAVSSGSWNVSPFQGVLPRNWRLEIVHLNADSITYSATASYIN